MATISFWGVFLIVIGLSLIIKTVFHLDFSIFRIAFAFVLIFFGVKLFLYRNYDFCKEERNLTIFGQRNITNFDESNEYHVIFGASKIDLRNVKFSPDKKELNLKINTIFGGTEILISDSTSVIINSHTVFAGTKLPDGNTAAFGTLSYNSDSSTHLPKIIIETNTIFGGLIVKK